MAAAVYGLMAAALFLVMRQPPLELARTVARVPRVLEFQILPFATLWKIARGGPLSVGDPAPDFDLERQDHSGRVRLSGFRGVRPVVLVFGSYT